MNILTQSSTANFFLILLSIASVASAIVMGIRTGNNQLKMERINLLEGDNKDLRQKLSEQQAEIKELQAKVTTLENEKAQMVGYTQLQALMADSAKHFDARVDQVLTAIASNTPSTTNVFSDGKKL